MRAKRTERGTLKMKVVYTTVNGETFTFRPNDDSNLLIPPVAFMPTADADFATVWDQSEESHILIGHRFPAFVEMLNGTVFVGGANTDGTFSTVLVTPNEKLMAVRAAATATGTVTVVQFKGRRSNCSHSSTIS
jgi:hypothetical protein